MRVHGKIEIKRRTYAVRRDYKSSVVRDMLCEDFHGLCGYCGKNLPKIWKPINVDHFVPQTVDGDRIDDYSNFVLSCPKCNRVKSNKWPTQDKSVAHTDEIGFIDPATDEYDVHICRNENGFIEGCTPLGIQMCRLMNFHLRKTDLFWKVNQLLAVKDEMLAHHKVEPLEWDEYRYLTDLIIELDSILDSLYEEKE